MVRCLLSDELHTSSDYICKWNELLGKPARYKPAMTRPTPPCYSDRLLLLWVKLIERQHGEYTPWNRGNRKCGSKCQGGKTLSCIFSLLPACIFTARRSYASAVLGVVILSACPSVYHTSALLQKQTMHCGYFDITRKGNRRAHSIHV